MSNTNSVFKKVPAKVQKLNGFDQSHLAGLSSFIGQLTPVLSKRLMPGDKVSLGSTFRVHFPPFATDTIGKITANLRAFFVPERLLYGGWKSFLMYSGGLADQFRPAGLNRTYLPTLSGAPSVQMNGPGSLMDYLGYKNLSGLGFSGIRSDKLLAYHLIWQDWYRDARIQVAPFYEGQSGVGPAYSRGTTYSSATAWTLGSSDTLADGTSIFSLRQVNYEKDYFTTAFTDQYGGATPMSVAVAPFVLPNDPTTYARNIVTHNAGMPSTALASDIDDNGSLEQLTQIGTFTIPQLRSANLLEKFAEKMCLSGGIYQDAILAEYGVRPSDGLVDRSIYLGSISASVFNNTVYATSSQYTEATSSNNPFAGSQGSSASNGKAIGSGSYVDNFQAKEHGVFMVLMDVVPHATYGTGTERDMFAIGDGFVDLFPVPSLSGLGHQPIYQAELVGGDVSTYGNAFGYTDRYADLKWTNDQIHGILRTGQSLDSFAIQRVFNPNALPSINTAFIEVKKSDLDNVTAVTSELSNFGYWVDMFHSFKLVRPLPAYSIPSLEGLENTTTVMVDRNGRRF